jgi:GT2 family glycosyltransferase
LATLSEPVRLVSPVAPQGYGANLNLGIRSLPPTLPFVILANDDVEFRGDTVAKLVDHLRVNARAGIIGPTLVTEGLEQPSVGEFPTPLDALIRSTALPPRVKALVQRVDGHRQMRRRAARTSAVTPEETRPVDWVIGAAMAVRLEAFHEIGGFDEDFFLYFEETDLCHRFWASGWIVLSARDATAVHLQGQSTGDREYRAVFREARRRYLIKRVGLTRWLMLELLFPVALGISLIGLLGALAEPGTIGSRVRAIRESWGRRAFLLPPSPRR